MRCWSPHAIYIILIFITLLHKPLCSVDGRSHPGNDHSHQDRTFLIIISYAPVIMFIFNTKMPLCILHFTQTDCCMYFVHPLTFIFRNNLFPDIFTTFITSLFFFILVIYSFKLLLNSHGPRNDHLHAVLV